MIPNENHNEASPLGTKVPSRQEQLFEIIVFLLLIIPSMVFAYYVTQQGQTSFLLVALSTIVRDVALVSLILFLLWHNTEPVRRIGWTFVHGWREILLGIVLFIPLFFLMGWLDAAFQHLGLTGASTTITQTLIPKGAGELMLSMIMVIVVAVAEETIFRGYLLLRFTAVTRSLLAAVLLSAAIFSLGHGYEGEAGVATVGMMGVVFALVYLWRKSLVAPMVMHLLQDLLSIVILPLFVTR